MGTALSLCEALLPDRQRVLGPDHPETLTTRHNIAYFTGQTGDVGTALSLCEALLPDRQRVFGPDHPYTRSIAAWIAHLQQHLPPDPQTTADPPNEASSSA